MRKNIIKAFTLVEMLIVIVIIGILIAALMPRMQSAQGRSRDVARKNDLAQLQTAIVTSYQDKGNWPGLNATYCKDEEATSSNAEGKCSDNNTWSSDVANEGISTNDVGQSLLIAGMSSIPKDPLSDTEVSGLGSTDVKITSGGYAYMVTKRNGTDNGGFVLMAKTEIEGGSNWIVCMNEEGTAPSGTTIAEGFIPKGEDLKGVKPCTTLKKEPGGTCGISDGVCTYTKDGELRYIVVY